MKLQALEPSLAGTDVSILLTEIGIDCTDILTTEGADVATGDSKSFDKAGGSGGVWDKIKDEDTETTFAPPSPAPRTTEGAEVATGDSKSFDKHGGSGGVWDKIREEDTEKTVAPPSPVPR